MTRALPPPPSEPETALAPLPVIQAKTLAPLYDVPPHDLKAECAVLGCCLIDAKAASIAFQMLEPSHFYNPKTQWLFKKFHAIFHKHGGRLDELVVLAHIEPKGDDSKTKMSRDNLRDYIARLIIDTPSAAGVEQYCNLVLREFKSRKLFEAALRLQQGIRDGHNPDRLSAGIQDELRSASLEMPEVDNTERQRVIPWPECPCISATRCFAPGAVTVVVGSGGTSKSFWVCELVWRLIAADVEASVLEMEESLKFHLDRCVAQWAGWSNYLNDDKVLDDPENIERSDRINVEFESIRSKLRDNGHIQTMQRPKTCANLLAWIHNEARRGRKVICIDAITLMRDERGKDQVRLLDEGKQIAVKYDAALVLVMHPKKSDKVIVRPTVGHIAGTVDFERTVSTILWLQAHATDQALFWPVDKYGEPIIGQPVPETRVMKSYSRTCWILKWRLNKFIGEKVAMFYNGGTLLHEERGWL